MKRPRVILLTAIVALLASAPSVMAAKRVFKAKLSGLDEAPTNITTGSGTLRVDVDSTNTTISFTLTFANLSANPVAAHIHIGQPAVNGGVSVFFCGGGGKPACPAGTSGAVIGTITAADVIGPVAQGVPSGNLAPLLTALRAKRTYANIHTGNFPSGEIRGIIK